MLKRQGSGERPGMSAPEPDDKGQGSLERLDLDLARFHAERGTARSGPRAGVGASAGYMLLGRMLSGVFTGLGLGWLVDRLAHTRPWGMVIGLFIGVGVSIYSAIRAVSRAGMTTRPGPSVPDDKDD